MADAAEIIAQVRPREAAPTTVTVSAAANVPTAKPVQTFQERLHAAAASLKAKEPAGIVPEPPKAPEPPPVPAEVAEAKPAAPVADPVKESPAVDAPKPDPKVAERLAIIAKHQRKLDEQARAQKAEFARKEAELAEKLKRVEAYEQARAKAKEDPHAYLRAADLSFEETAKKFIEKTSKDPLTIEQREMQLREQIRQELLAEVEKKLAATRQSEEEAQRQAYEQRVREQVVSQIRASDAYPLTKWKGAEADVLEYAKAVFTTGDARRGFKPGTQLTLEKAAEVVENFLRQDAEKQFGKERVAAFLAAQATQEAKSDTPAELSAGKPAGAAKHGKTLSNDKATSAAGDDDWTKLPLEERKRRAAQLLRGARK